MFDGGLVSHVARRRREDSLGPSRREERGINGVHDDGRREPAGSSECPGTRCTDTHIYTRLPARVTHSACVCTLYMHMNDVMCIR